MVLYCSVPQCSTYATEPGVSFHFYPKEKKLRNAWLVKLRMGKEPSSYARVCSKHFREEDFVYGVGARMFVAADVPLATVHPTPKPPADTLDIQAQSSEYEIQQSLGTSAFSNHEDVNNEDGLEDVPAAALAFRREIGLQVNTLDAERHQPLSIARVKTQKDLSVITGLPCYQLFYNLCDLYTDSRMLMQAKSFCLCNEDAVLMTMMKLHHNVPFSLIGVLFGIHRTTAADIFKATIATLAEILQTAVFWPSKEAVVDNLTVHFKEYPNVRAVLDCTEIPLQRPKDLESQLLTYSWYKGTYTAKVLVCETPGGHISFLSKAYGGRASDSFITKESKILEKFLPSIDSVMVDKGFLIDELCLQHHVTMVRPPFLRKKKQLTQREAQQNQSIAAARVHVERAIQRMKVFKILSGNLGTELFPYIDDILTVIAGIVNLSKPIFSAEKFLYE
ncbi:uncharacterized protein LOC119383744 isoform X2 [Rhipicephalus sanguineus]|uniref:uncharacterized protein LOC119383744 isoform X2 n=1 Tax=Rhipicephalus sanguineus TaxID=34632 RepID=UPI0020C39E90|nr:uncharacterized protein LOC119383744 isoform X2 [Rhipicephalus sanguineus]